MKWSGGCQGGRSRAKDDCVVAVRGTPEALVTGIPEVLITWSGRCRGGQSSTDDDCVVEVTGIPEVLGTGIPKAPIT